MKRIRQHSPGQQETSKKKSRRNNKAAQRKQATHDLPCEKTASYYAGVDVMDCMLMSFVSIDGNNNVPDSIDKSLDDVAPAPMLVPLKICNDDTDVISTVPHSTDCIDGSIVDNGVAAATMLSKNFGNDNTDGISAVLNTPYDVGITAAASSASSTRPP